MAKFTLTIESEELSEIAEFIDAANGTTPAPRTVAPRSAKEVEPETSEEQEPEVEAPKSTRTRKPKAEKVVEQEPAGEPEATKPESGDSEEQHPMLAEVTLADIKEKASEVLAKGGDIGPTLMGKLKERFGAQAFSQVKPEDYARCMAMLEELAA